jgi:hypothetical protein
LSTATVTWYDKHNRPVEIVNNARVRAFAQDVLGLRPVPDVGTPEGWHSPTMEHSPDYYAPGTQMGLDGVIRPSGSGE